MIHSTKKYLIWINGKNRTKISKAFRHFEEVFAFPDARSPEDVE